MMTLENQIGIIIEASRRILSEDAISEVDHYYIHGEYEMAFEGLIIELMKTKQAPSGYNFKQWCDLICEMGLNKAPVFDGNLYSKFIFWNKSLRE